MPLVTVVVPVHNREDLLPETLDSVRAQTFTDWECIVVDDHSTDGSLAVAQRYAEMDPRFRAVSLPDPKRYSNAARNYGLSLARGEFVNFLDSDDLFAPDKIRIQIDVFGRESEIDFVMCRHALFQVDPSEDAWQAKFAPLTHSIEYMLEGQMRAAVTRTIAPLWKKTSLFKLGGWDEANPGGAWQDPDLFLRAAASRQKFTRVEQVLCYARRGDHARLTTLPSAYRRELQRSMVRKTWTFMCKNGMKCRELRYFCSENYYHLAISQARDGNLIGATKAWIYDSRTLGISPISTYWVLIAMILLGNKYTSKIGGAMRRVYEWIYRRDVPSPLPYLEGMPRKPPVR